MSSRRWALKRESYENRSAVSVHKYDLFYTSNKFDSGHKLPLGSCTGHGTLPLSDVRIFSLAGVEPDIQVQGKFTLFGGARLFFLGGSSVNNYF